MSNKTPDDDKDTLDELIRISQQAKQGSDDLPPLAPNPILYGGRDIRTYTDALYQWSIDFQGWIIRERERQAKQGSDQNDTP